MIIGKKNYTLDLTLDTKKIANQRAIKLRNQGLNARVIPFGKRYSVFYAGRKRRSK